MADFRIVSRSEWGAVHPDGAGAARVPADEVWLHHSVTARGAGTVAADTAAMRTLERIGQERFKAGVSYTFAVTFAGRIFEGHSVHRQGTHTGGHNTAGRGIVLIGNFETERPSERSLDAVAWLLVEGKRNGWWKQARLNGGHRDVKATACPGQHAYALIAEINRRAAALESAPNASNGPDLKLLAAIDAQVRARPYTGLLGDRRRNRSGQTVPRSVGPSVEAVQWRLTAMGFPCAVDGIYGPETTRQVTAFQRKHRLMVDGLTGKQSWNALGLRRA